MDWPERAAGSNLLPLTASVEADFGTNGSKAWTPQAGGAYQADFGYLDLPVVGRIRARSGIRYSKMYPRGSLELAARKELSDGAAEGYEAFLAAQSVGDDRRLDTL